MFEKIRSHFKGKTNITGLEIEKELSEAEAETKRLEKETRYFVSFAANAQMSHQACEQELKVEKTENDKLKDENAKLKLILKQALESDSNKHARGVELQEENAKLRDEVESLKKINCELRNTEMERMLELNKLSAKYQNLRTQLHNLSK